MLTMRKLLGVLDLPERAELLELMAKDTDTFPDAESRDDLRHIAQLTKTAFLRKFPVPTAEMLELAKDSQVKAIHALRAKHPEVSLYEAKRVFDYNMGH